MIDKTNKTSSLIYGGDLVRPLNSGECKQVSDFLLMCPINKLVDYFLSGNTNEVGSLADVLAVVNANNSVVAV